MIETVPVPVPPEVPPVPALVLELMPVPDVLDAVDVLIAPGLKTDRRRCRRNRPTGSRRPKRENANRR